MMLKCLGIGLWESSEGAESGRQIQKHRRDCRVEQAEGDSGGVGEKG